MNGLGDEFLAGAAFAADEHGGAGGGDLGDEIEQLLHAVALADDTREIEALFERALELEVFFAQPARLDGLRDLREELIIGPGFGDVIHGTALEGGAGHVNGAVRGDEHDGEMRVAAANFLEQIESVAVGQAHVEEQEVEGMLFELGKSGFAGFSAGDAVPFAFKEQLEPFANFRFVVDNQNGAFRHEPLSSQRETRHGTRCPCRALSERRFFRHVL